MKVLSENPNTDFVSAHSIRFTPAFKDQLWKYVQSGKNPRDVFEKAGYDLNWIGQRRIDNLVQKLQKQREPRENNTVPAWKYQKALAEAEALRREIDSLKRILRITDARKYRI
nr:HTH domain-containing protein [Allobaculum fili]